MAYTACGRIHDAVYRNDKPGDYAPVLFLVEMAGGKTLSKNGFHCAAMNQEFLNILELESAKNTKNSNIFILHSLNGNTFNFWGKHIKDVFGDKKIDIFMPSFPIMAESSYEKFDYILNSYLSTGQLNYCSIVVCYSIGNAYFLRFCCTHNFTFKCFVSVTPDAIYEYTSNQTEYIIDVKKQAYLTSKDFNYYYSNLQNVYCLYSNEDDKKEEKFTRLISDFKTQAIYLKDYSHFDGYHRIYEIPELIELLDKFTKI